MQTLYNRQNKAKSGKLVGTSQYNTELNQNIDEKKKLKQQLKISEMEKEFLKKAATYLTNESQ